MRVGAGSDGSLNVIDMNVLSIRGLTASTPSPCSWWRLQDPASLQQDEGIHYGGKSSTPTSFSRRLPRLRAIQANFALESMMDELAHALAIVPIALREKNMIREGETSEVFRIMGEGGEGIENVGGVVQTRLLRRSGRGLIGWEPGRLAWEVAPGRVRAKGMAIAMQGSGISARGHGVGHDLSSRNGGCFKLRIGATDLGTGQRHDLGANSGGGSWESRCRDIIRLCFRYRSHAFDVRGLRFEARPMYRETP